MNLIKQPYLRGIITLQIRAHHLFCLLAYEGNGYNKQFNETFSKLQGYYLKPNSKIEPISTPDGSCKSCPNFKNWECQAEGGEANVNDLDSNTIKLLDLEEGKSYNSEEIWDKISKLSIDKICKLCTGCSWLKKSACPPKILLKTRQLIKSLKS